MRVTHQAADIAALVDVIWTSTSGFHATPFEGAADRRWDLPVVEAQVHITGGWQGAVVLHMPQKLAELLARRILGLGFATPTFADLQAAFGEIANMARGKIKGLIADEDVQLSLPVVIHGCGCPVRISAGEVFRAGFLCEGHPIVVMVLRAEVPTRWHHDRKLERCF